jgi:hypothetical protein
MEFASGSWKCARRENEWFHDWKSQNGRDDSCLQVNDKATERYTRAPSPLMMS